MASICFKMMGVIKPAFAQHARTHARGTAIVKKYAPYVPSPPLPCVTRTTLHSLTRRPPRFFVIQGVHGHTHTARPPKQKNTQAVAIGNGGHVDQRRTNVRHGTGGGGHRRRTALGRNRPPPTSSHFHKQHHVAQRKQVTAAPRHAGGERRTRSCRSIFKPVRTLTTAHCKSDTGWVRRRLVSWCPSKSKSKYRARRNVTLPKRIHTKD